MRPAMRWTHFHSSHHEGGSERARSSLANWPPPEQDTRTDSGEPFMTSHCVWSCSTIIAPPQNEQP
jgi:hypothetical protein